MLAPTVSHVLLVSLLASFLPCAFSLSTAGLKQATRQQVVDRQLVRRLSPLRPRQSPAPCVPQIFTGAPPSVTPDTIPYNEYFQGAGVQENADNDGNTNPATGFQPHSANLIDPDLLSAVNDCATYADIDGYGSFDLSFLLSTCQWYCTIYSGANTDPAAFNVPNPDVLQTYGYST